MPLSHRPAGLASVAWLVMGAPWLVGRETTCGVSEIIVTASAAQGS
jgi:hypothetical protein